MAEPLEPSHGPSHDDDALDALVRHALPDEPAPVGFAERALARRRPARRAWPALVAVGALAASVAALVLLSRSGAPDQGALVATARETLALGRATVVAEPGASLAWRVEQNSATRVRLEQGRAFFRVDRGSAPFLVDTAAGRVVVHGTCFTVSVEAGPALAAQEPAMPSLALPSRVPSIAAGAVLGAALSGAVVVAVYEGRVSLENEQGQVSVGPGEEARAERQGMPHAVVARPADADALGRTAAALARAEQALEASRAASGGDVRVLLEENAQLRAELSEQRAEVAVMQAERAEDRGEAVPFPDDLPPRFSEAALLKSFQQAFADVGMKGEVSHIDCTEYPCIVYGKVPGDTRDLMKQLQQSSAFREYSDDDRRVSGWARDEGGPEQFAVVLTPKTGAEPDDQDAAVRRLRWRVDQGRAGSR
ncbi:MAG: FecR domain-containing protein [Deltaproteobacteria bacterium]|nr:FecR domain-containing protein [Deltaproteobacteria bacterium]